MAWHRFLDALSPWGYRAGRASAGLEEVLAQREHLLGCALQLLGDPSTATGAVLTCVQEAVRSPYLVTLDGQGVEQRGAALRRFLEGLLVRRALELLRANAPQRRLQERPQRPEAPAGGPPGGRAQLRQVAQVLSALPPLGRTTLVLVVMQGRSVAEAAVLCGCGEAASRFWLAQGRKLLRRALQRDLALAAEGEAAEGERRGEARDKAPPGAMHELRGSKKAIARA